jgi:Peptidase S46
MKTTSLILTTSLACTAFSWGIIPVTDYAHIITSQVNWAASLGQWAHSAANQATQISNQVSQIQKAATELKRLGDPAALIGNLDLASLTQISSATQLASSYQAYATAAQKQPLATLQRLGSGGFTAPASTLKNGSSIQRNPDAYRQYATHGAIIDDYRARSPQLAASRKSLQGQINQTASQLDAASTDSEVAKLQGRMAILQGQQEQLSREESLAAAQSTLEKNDVEMSRRAQAQAQAEAFDQERQAALTAATQGSVPEPKPAKNVP